MTELWADILAAATLGLIAYASTNLDNLLLLASMSRAPGGASAVRKGFGLASLAVLLISLSFIGLGLLMPTSALGYLGVIPITLGVRQLLFNPGQAPTQVSQQMSTTSVATILLANSSDTVAAFGPLMAESELAVLVVLVLMFALAASLTITLVNKLQASIGEQAWLDALAAKGTPFIMILVGSYILLNTTTDLV